MHLRDILRVHLDQLSDPSGRGLRIVETGTIRGDEERYAQDDGWSTVHMAQWAEEHFERDDSRRPLIISIDLEIDTAQRVLERHDLLPYVDLVQGHSVDILGSMIADGLGGHDVDLAYLDSDNDPTLILCEFLLVSRLVRPGGIILIDDVDPSSKSGARKGHAVMPWLDARQQEYSIVGRAGAGYSTNVLVTRKP